VSFQARLPLDARNAASALKMGAYLMALSPRVRLEYVPIPNARINAPPTDALSARSAEMVPASPTLKNGTHLAPEESAMKPVNVFLYVLPTAVLHAKCVAPAGNATSPLPPPVEAALSAKCALTGSAARTPMAFARGNATEVYVSVIAAILDALYANPAPLANVQTTIPSNALGEPVKLEIASAEPEMLARFPTYAKMAHVFWDVPSCFAT